MPALILFTYTFFVIHISNREKRRRRNLVKANICKKSLKHEFKIFNFSYQEATSDAEEKRDSEKNILEVSNQSKVSLPSTSGDFDATHKIAPQADTRTSNKTIDNNELLISKAKKFPRAFEKNRSLSQMQILNSQSPQILVEHEKKLKKSRSFDKNNYLVEPCHMTDSEKIKTKR